MNTINSRHLLHFIAKLFEMLLASGILDCKEYANSRPTGVRVNQVGWIIVEDATCGLCDFFWLSFCVICRVLVYLSDYWTEIPYVALPMFEEESGPFEFSLLRVHSMINSKLIRNINKTKSK